MSDDQGEREVGVDPVREIEELVRSGRQGCLTLRTLLASSDGPAGVVAGVQFAAYSLEAIFEGIDEALGDIGRTGGGTRSSAD
jgi:hypothetical protein